MSMLEARPYRPFKSSEEYLEAMKEDLAEWLGILYPELQINSDNFMDRLDTGVALCKHANLVRQAAEDYLIRRQARNKSMTRSITSGIAGPILAMGDIHYLPNAKSGTFFARDNVSNFITWCRKSLNIIECLLFETDDLIMRKNEKHVILCLLEVARRGAKFGMLAPMLVQMERQIDREIAADIKANGISCGAQTENDSSIGDMHQFTLRRDSNTFDSESENENDENERSVLVYGPQPQIITNDLKSLDEMVRELLEKCICPSQFPMVRESEGKYRIGDTKVLIFVRILRSHVMVRVGGGWDTLSHYLNKHDPCRCRTQHRTLIGARLIPRTNMQSNSIELHKTQVKYERSPPISRKSANKKQGSDQSANTSTLTEKSQSLSPSQRKTTVTNSSNQDNTQSSTIGGGMRGIIPPCLKRLNDQRKKMVALETGNYNQKFENSILNSHNVHFDDYSLIKDESFLNGAPSHSISLDSNNISSNFENSSDNGSEISDEGYRSLGLIQPNAQKHESLQSQACVDDAENIVRIDQTCKDSPLSPVHNMAETFRKSIEIDDKIFSINTYATNDSESMSLPCVLNDMNDFNFKKSGVFITDEDITVSVKIATEDSNKAFNSLPEAGESYVEETYDDVNNEIPCTSTIRRHSLDYCNSSESLISLYSQNGSPIFNREKYGSRSMRKSINNGGSKIATNISNASEKHRRKIINKATDRIHTSDLPVAIRRPPTPTNGFNRHIRIRSSQNFYDNNGRNVKSGGTSPVKNHFSPLTQQLLEAASSAKSDNQILEKIKKILSKYGSTENGATSMAFHHRGRRNESRDGDITSVETHCYGQLERSTSCLSPRNIAAKRRPSSTTLIRDISVSISPRRDLGSTKIPAPIRANTETW